MLHVDERLFRAPKSLVVDSKFFVSGEATFDLEAELLATLRLLLEQDVTEQDAVQCRFPARARWLEEQLGISQQQIVKVDCKQYRAWRQEMDVETAWLIFPSAHLNSPSSMFGHTLLRLDPPKSKSSSTLLAKAVNYAANVNNKDFELLYAYKGLFGGYPGEFSIVPYHKKVKEYGLIEKRDIWEYRLNLTEDEIDWLLRHLWELRDIEFQYFFSSKNCSYQLLALLDVARVGSQLTSAFPRQTIPVDTVRVLEQQSWIAGHEYRPSQAREFYELAQNLNSDERNAVIALQSQSPAEVAMMESMTLERQQLVVDIAYKLARINKKTVSSKQALEILKFRSSLGKRSSAPTDIYSQRPEKSHYSNRLVLAAGEYENSNESYDGLYVSYRPAFHSLDDALRGFSPGAQINFLETELFITEDELLVRRFNVLDIRSLSVSDRYIKQLSWQVVGGAERKLNMLGEWVMMPHLSAEAGRTVRFGPLQAYALAGLHLAYNRSAGPSLPAGPALDIGLLWQSLWFTSELRYEFDYSIQDHQEREALRFNAQLPLAQNWSLGVAHLHEQFETQRYRESFLKLNYYF